MKSAIMSNLDPHTLRWVADELVQQLDPEDTMSGAARRRQAKQLAKRYRGLATRIENKRGKR